MKRTTRLFFTSILLAVFLLSACAPAAPSPTPEPAPVLPTQAQPEESALPTATQPEAAPEAILAPTEAPVQFVPTSRGPDLHATDPTTVSLASGGLHLVEFFRFT